MAHQHPGNADSVTVLIVSPVQVMCDALRRVLTHEKQFRILDHQGSLYKVAQLCREDPNLIVVCDGSSTEAQRFIAASSRRLASCRLLVFGVRSRRMFLRNCGEIRIHGLTPRNATLKDLVDAIKRVHRHGSFVSTALQLSTSARSPLRLTDREREIATLISRRLTNKQIAGRLRVSEHTVKVHVRHILAKLEVRGRNDVATGITTR